MRLEEYLALRERRGVDEAEELRKLRAVIERQRARRRPEPPPSSAPPPPRPWSDVGEEA
jgi:hypothetical protein